MLDLRANEFAGDTLVSFIEVTILEFLEKMIFFHKHSDKTFFLEIAVFRNFFLFQSLNMINLKYSK